MVLVQRRAGSASGTSPTHLYSSSIAYGDGQVSATRSNQPISSPGYAPSPSTQRSFSFDASNGRSKVLELFPSYLNKIVLALVIISWTAAIVTSKSAMDLWKDADYQVKANELNLESNLQDLHDAQLSRTSFQKQVDLLTNADHVLKHEDRMALELEEAGVLQLSLENPDMFSHLLEKRKSILNDKISALQDYIKSESKSEVLRKYGHGPHRVNITVEFSVKEKVDSFVVQLASLDEMPHSVYTFLEQVSYRLWDGTVFWHHARIDHVLSAAPVDYKNRQNKLHHFEGSSVASVSFAEYSNDLPHTEYTIGFSERGPQFYINYLDNTKLHGPGGQKHHQLPDEADPCFGTVVSGKRVVDEMYEIQVSQSREDAENRDWHDHELTHILRIEILK